jgi:hypothetical protein
MTVQKILATNAASGELACSPLSGRSFLPRGVSRNFYFRSNGALAGSLKSVFPLRGSSRLLSARLRLYAAF